MKGENTMIQQGNGSRRRLLFAVLVVIGLFTVAACAAIQQQPAYHRILMKGSIIYTTDTGLYLCIGKKDGASVGQELGVYKITYTGLSKAPSFKREKTGKVKIIEIIDEHFAMAVVVSGTAVKNDIVELEP
jgi:hypothetical protein